MELIDTIRDAADLICDTIKKARENKTHQIAKKQGPLLEKRVFFSIFYESELYAKEQGRKNPLLDSDEEEYHPIEKIFGKIIFLILPLIRKEFFKDRENRAYLECFKKAEKDKKVHKRLHREYLDFKRLHGIEQ